MHIELKILCFTNFVQSFKKSYTQYYFKYMAKIKVQKTESPKKIIASEFLIHVTFTISLKHSLIHLVYYMPAQIPEILAAV